MLCAALLRPLGGTAEMLDAVVVFCGLLGVFLWWLTNNYDGEEVKTSNSDNSPSITRRRNRGNKSKKRKQRGKDTVAKTPAPPDAQEWPTLGGSSQEQQEEGEEDLAALHAEMLKATRSAAAEKKGGGGKGKAGEVGREPRKGGRIGVGDRVEGRFEAGAEWFPAVVTKTLHGGLVNLLYDDGERETKVPLSLVRHRGAPEPCCSDSDLDSEASSGSDRSEEEIGVRGLQVARKDKNQADGWEVIVQKPKKTRVERVEARAEANSNLKNRLKRQKKREKELAAREALRKKL